MSLYGSKRSGEVYSIWSTEIGRGVKEKSLEKIASKFYLAFQKWKGFSTKMEGKEIHLK